MSDYYDIHFYARFARQLTTSNSDICRYSIPAWKHIVNNYGHVLKACIHVGLVPVSSSL